MPFGEVITLQLGHYANFVGSHLWNLQEACFSYKPNDTTIPLEFVHDVFFREGRNPKGQVTFTPRLLIADLQGSLVNLKATGSLYDLAQPLANEAIAWSGKVTIYKTEPSTLVPGRSAGKGARSLPADQDKDVCRAAAQEPGGHREYAPWRQPAQLWTEFLKVQLHPRTIHLISHHLHQSADDPFDLFGSGSECAADPVWQESFMDDTRWFAEDCDALQAFNVLLDGHNGFTGLTSSLLEALQDDYPNKAFLCWPLYQPSYRSTSEGRVAVDMAHRHFNTVMCYSSLNRLSAAFCPLSVASSHFGPPVRGFKHLALNLSEPHETSAVLGLALDNVLCGLKLRSPLPLEVAQLCGQLCYSRNKLCVLGLSLPLGLGERQLLADCAPSAPVLLTPGAHVLTQSTTSLAVLRGCAPSMVTRLPPRVQDPGEVIGRFATRACEGTPTWLRKVENASRLGTHDFPNIFGPLVTPNGLVSCLARDPHMAVEQVPSLSCLQAAEASAAEVVSEVVQRGSQLDLSRFHRCLLAGTEVDLYREALHQVQELAA